MRLILRSSGGVGGFNQRVEGQIDAGPDLQRRIAELKQNGQLHPFALPPRHPDAMTYVIDLTNEKFIVEGSSASAAAIQLVDDIRREIATQRRA